MSQLEIRDSGMLWVKENSYRSDGIGIARDKIKWRIGISATVVINNYDPWTLEICFFGFNPNTNENLHTKIALQFRPCPLHVNIQI